MAIAASQISRLLVTLRASANAEEDRRDARRVTIVTRGVVRVTGDGGGQRFSVLTRDISITGLGLIAAAPIQRGLRISVELDDGAGQIVRMSGVVRHCRAMADGLWGVGVDLTDADDSTELRRTAIGSGQRA